MFSSCDFQNVQYGVLRMNIITVTSNIRENVKRLSIKHYCIIYLSDSQFNHDAYCLHKDILNYRYT